MEALRAAHGRPRGPRVGPLRGRSPPRRRLERFLAGGALLRRRAAAARRRRPSPCPDRARRRAGSRDLDPDGFGQILDEIAREGGAARRPHRHDLARRHRLDQPRPLGEPARPVRPRRAWPTRSRPSASPRPSAWDFSPEGQHFELGIAEMNLFIDARRRSASRTALRRAAAAGRHALRPLHRCAALDALNYACYQDARFILVGDALGRDAGARGRRAPVDRARR